MGWFEDVDWGNLAAGATAGAAGYGIDYLKKQDEIAKAQRAYDMTAEKLNSQVDLFRQDFASELSGQMTPTEIAARDAALSKTRATLDKNLGVSEAALQQQYTRSGIGGEELSKALTELRDSTNQKYLDYETELNATLLDRAATRAANAKAALTNLRTQVASTLTPMETALEQGKSSLAQPGTYDIAKYLLPGVAAAGIAGVGEATAKKDETGKSTYGGPTPEQAFRETQLSSLLQNLGLDPKMFAKGDTTQELPKDIGGELYQPETTTERDLFGNVSKKTTYKNVGKTAEQKAKENVSTYVINPDGSINQTIAGSNKVVKLPAPSGTANADPDKKVQAVLNMKTAKQKLVYDPKKFGDGQYAAFQNLLKESFSGNSNLKPEVVDSNGAWPGGKMAVQITRADGVYQYKGTGDINDANSWKKVK
jgi:hypothetical protein